MKKSAVLFLLLFCVSVGTWRPAVWSIRGGDGGGHRRDLAG